MIAEKTPNFLGLGEVEAKYDDARIVVLPVPYEETVSYGEGTERGPKAIIDASTQVELYDEELECESYKVGVTTCDPLAVKGVAPENLFEVITPAVTNLLDDGKCPLVLGGEHSITPPIIKAVKRQYPDLTVVQLDAHADLREEYRGSPMSHACAMARVREMCPAVQIGIRSISVEGAARAKEKDYSIIFAHEMQCDHDWMSWAISEIKTDNIYITLDVDAFDASILPATGTPEPGGMNWYQITRFINLLNSEKNVVGMDLVELAPIEGLRAYDYLIAKLAYKYIGYWGRSKDLV